MKITRKDFLKLAGGAALATGAGTLVHAIGEVEHEGGSKVATAAGQKTRWGMVIDFQKCKEKGCDDCLKACREVHNIPQIADKAHEVKWIWKEECANVFRCQPMEFMPAAMSAHVLPVMCNQCTAPACVRVCPTQATFKREEDGIVMMDWHRCIGCRYCMAACPYGSRSFNWVDPRPYVAHENPDFPTRTKGVVEKCNFCEERLGRGQQPACVEACPEKALIFGNLNDENSTVRQVLRARFGMQRQPELGTGPNIFYLM